MPNYRRAHFRFLKKAKAQENEDRDILEASTSVSESESLPQVTEKVRKPENVAKPDNLRKRVGSKVQSGKS